MSRLHDQKMPKFATARRDYVNAAPYRTPCPLGASLLIAAGVTLSSSAWAETQAPASASPASAVALPAVVVSAAQDPAAERTRSVDSGALGTRKQIDTPFSTHVVTSAEAKNLMAQTSNDLFEYDPAVTITGENTTGENAYFSVRGLPLDMLNSIKVDGQTFPAWDTELSLEPFEQVELLKGLSGFMYGFGTPGGIVNYVLKRPTDTPYRSLSVGYLSAGVFSEKLDVGGRFGKDDRFGYRFNLVNEDGDTAQAHGHLRRQVASAALDFRIAPDLTWTVDALYQKRKTTGTLFGLMFGSGLGIPDAGSISRSLTQPQNFYQTEMASVGTGLGYRLSENWRASVKYRFAKENRTNSDGFLFVNDAAGDYSNTLFAGETRYFYQNLDAMLQGRFDTGPLRHDLVLGLGYQTQASEYDNSVGWNNGYFLGNGNLYTSTLLTNSAVSIGANLYKQSWLSQTAAYASDTVRITPRLSALLGLRYTQYRQSVYTPAGAVSSQYSANPTTPTAALMFKTDAYSTLYASYVESLQQGGSASNTNVNYPATYGPLRSKQYELGFKADHRAWGANVALFRVDEGYDYTNTANVYVQSGTQRFTGVDAGGWVKLANDWRLLGGVMWLNAKAVGIDDAAIEGKRIFGTPRFTATGRIEYNPSSFRPLTLAFGGKYVGNMAVDAANTQFVPSYVTFDLSGKVETEIAGKAVVLRAGIDNVFNRRYWMTSFGAYVLPSATRTAVASATMEF